MKSLGFKIIVTTATVFALTVNFFFNKIRETDPRPWFDRGHHDRYTWSRELGDDYVVTETAYAPIGYKFIIMKSRDRELREHGYRRSTSYYDFTGPKPIVVLTVKGPKEKRPCLVTTTELTYKTAMADLADRNGSTSATSLKPVKSVDGTILPLDTQGELDLFRDNPGIRAVCQGRRVVDTRMGIGSANSENSRVVKVLLMDVVVNVVQLKSSSRKSSWRSSNFFDL
ncbi:hypothetical protein PoB_004818800 [Plakobranchus ocellatus]|uniref:Uncharacterized protein n=1 Tax=Plakobranchus ocellatus TaxID=259542 RepID=A0AAV4BQ32_9GAST|nr:hypothetical protein PoB_004818800 [Plakobranchus ocellatus]